MQDSKVVEVGAVQEFRRRCQAEGQVFWARDDVLAVLDAQTAQRVEATNYADLTMLDGFADVLRQRTSEPVTWDRLRTAWLAQMRNLTSAPRLRRLAQLMEQLLDAQAGRHQDLVWLAERAVVEPLVPAIIAGLKPRAHKRVVREVMSKVAWVLADVDLHRIGRWNSLRMNAYQLTAGWEVRRELKGRVNGRRPRQQDLTDPVVDMVPELGLDRAVDSVTALLTAITGSPGAAATCLFFEWSRQQAWRARLEAELNGMALDALCESPVRLAPMTTRFVKEILRIYSSPPVVSRTARTDISQGQACLKTGQHYLLSSFFVHHDANSWADPDVFNPDRWLADGRQPCPHGSYVPFGWAPKACIGANLGMAQLIILTHLLCTRYRLEVTDPEQAKVCFASVVRPVNFMGSVSRR